MSKTWAEETIEHWLPEKGQVYVFRYVPQYAYPGDTRREGQPTFDDWLDDMRAAANGLEGPMAGVQRIYGDDHFGVTGHRPMTADERAERIEDTAAEIRRQQRQLDYLLPPVAGATTETDSA